jgi:hypothetical protein
MKQVRKPRRVLRTVLLVGEGASEVLFLEHLKRLYHQRGSGLAIAIKNAHGKGAGHVIILRFDNRVMRHMTPK